jgi:hypothetical protein
MNFREPALGRMKLLSYLLRVGCHVCALFLLVISAPMRMTAAETNSVPFNENQQRIEEWTTRQFRGFLDNRTFAGWTQAERAAL